MGTSAKSRRPAPPPAHEGHFNNVIAIAGGAIMRVENVELLLDASDAEVGRLLKAEVRSLHGELNLVPPGKKDIVLARGHEVTANLPDDGHVANEDSSDAHAIEESRKSRRKLVKAGELITSAQLQDALKITRQSVSYALGEKRFFRIEVDGRHYFPAFLTGTKVDRRVLESVSKELGSLPGWLKWDFFNEPRETLLGMSALKALEKGKEELVHEVARRFLAEESEFEEEAVAGETAA